MEAEVKLKKVRNGYIVEIISYGMSVLKEPYEPGIYVFTELCKAEEFMESIFEPKTS